MTEPRTDSIPVTEPGSSPVPMTGPGSVPLPDFTGGSCTGAKFSSGRVLVHTFEMAKKTVPQSSFQLVVALYRYIRGHSQPQNAALFE